MPWWSQRLLRLDSLCPEFFEDDAGDGLDEAPGLKKRGKRTALEDAAFRMTLLKEYLKAGEGHGSGVTAYERACEIHKRPVFEDRTRSSKAANKILSMPASKQMLKHLRARMKAEVEADAAEYYRSLRLMQQVAYGLVPVQESYVDPESGEVLVRDVRMPNAANQAKSTELIGKAIGIFQEKIAMTVSHDDALELLDGDD